MEIVYMRSANIFASFLLCIIVSSAYAQPVPPPQLGKDSVEQAVAAMSLEEKAGLVVGTSISQGNGSSVIGITQEIVPGAAGATLGVERLGITRMSLADGPAGLRIASKRPSDNNTYYCTAFPVGTLLASTWDTELIYEVGEAMGNEVLEYGVDVLLAPGMNIQRNPLCGRNFEYYSEDPFVTGKIAAAIVNGIESQGVGTSIKHFAANNSETNRDTLDTNVNERALREIYLEGFRIAVEEAQPWTVMSSYNKINGTYTSERRDLLTDILRNDWGFKGLVITDWFGGSDPIAQMQAGNDLIMPGNREKVATILEGVKSGKLDIRILNENVKRILKVVLQSPRFKGHKFSNKPDLTAHAGVTRRSAAEGMVLLKNNGALPFTSEVQRVAVFGNPSYAIIPGGVGSGSVSKAYVVDLVEGLRNVGLAPNEDLEALYLGYFKALSEGIPTPKKTAALMWLPKSIPELVTNDQLATSMAKVSNAAVITIGRNAGEARDRTNEEGDFKLTAIERDLVKSVTSAFHAQNKKVVVVLNIGGVIETASWKEMPDAILLAWQGGQETGNSVADILRGNVNPSGKLAITFPTRYEDVPSAATFPGKEVSTAETAGSSGKRMKKLAEITYDDGIYVGYRYYETFKVQPSYEFGYGLSYTTFTYSGIKVSSSTFSDKIVVTFDVKNSGAVAGKEVVQLYLSAPAKKLEKPVIELKGFAKTRLLQPGETQTLTFTLDARSLASFEPAISSWIAEQGTYTVKLGASSKDIRQQATFALDKDIIVKKESVALVPKVKIREQTPGR